MVAFPRCWPPRLTRGRCRTSAPRPDSSRPGVTDFWVPRGYAHVIANLRGTCGSGGTFTFFDTRERQDVHDLVEWVAAQPWCDGNIGMIGIISYFAMTQHEAAVERPPHLKAIFPWQ
ncbi:MAG TPA: CocE/NonD family hydrolase [Mycobacterium sp.]|nr:CocE/NonD family hydrolase [Mycobacterium sp.]HTX95061.1 CocE/NonD family hydrolase [Mycobacterium sp.]